MNLDSFHNISRLHLSNAHAFPIVGKNRLQVVENTEKASVTPKLYAFYSGNCRRLSNFRLLGFNLVFETRTGLSVKLKELPSIGKTIFHRAPRSGGAQDYYSLSLELLSRLGQQIVKPELRLIAGTEVNHV
jgi:hypothetical protein